ncbi:phosphoesterase [Streptomyces scopuliridis]|uniref:Phosphoesterase n=1 Tax=Streptomyces scopuliridis TaxID=452529 RepID=A0ACD4ZGZ2_9ACTN|nr:phosphoesterase [Streptomyces scopuliridis]WSB33472.1 phosphoesterase [Streptomyces scopuliridis]WSB97742.1 phosphoesterase [Streptomyces scopuliridis]WSC08555.1 phosphoesterase [Streptomyces scopuliridis]
MNLLVNGDAERGPGGSVEPVTVVDGWVVREGAPALVGYDVGNGYPTPADPGPAPAHRGSRFFSGGNSPRTALVQDVALPVAGTVGRAAVDAGRVRYAVSGWLGGYATQEDGARLSVEFRDGRGTPVALSVLGPVTAAERGGRTALVERTAEAAVPPGARSARVLLVFTRAGSGVSNDGYADAISLTLTASGGRA